MNLATKVFIILNLLLTLGFAYVSMLYYATNENWKRRWDTDTRSLSDSLKASNDLTLSLSTARATAEAALQTSKADIQRLTTELQQTRSDVTAKDKDLENKNLTISQMQRAIEAVNKQNTALAAQLEIARARKEELSQIVSVARAVAHKLEVRIAELEDDYNHAQAQLQMLETTVAGLETEKRRLDARLALVQREDPALFARINSDTPSSRDLIQGAVAVIERNPQGQQHLVMLTIGNKSADVQRNMEFVIFRGNQYICRVRVERVFDDAVAARVVPEFWNTRGLEIQTGDTAQNRLW
jgi:predicted RNase H-like nuclease (RuvC/YqgF family)